MARASMVVVWTLMAGFVSGLSATATARESRPNLLILMADNWAWPHASALGDPVVQTPTFDRLAANGVVFRHAFCSVPSCAPARAVFLTGRHAHRLGPAANLHGTFPAELTCFPDLLEAAGYTVGYSGKGWGPGNVVASGRTRNPAGPKYLSFLEFLKSVPTDQPFCFWFSSRDPHVPWTEGAEFLPDLSPEKVPIPPPLPDHPIVREDILRYYAEVQNFDRDCAQHLEWLKQHRKGQSTLIVMLSDNGWQMPRGLAHIYDAGTRIPLVIAWEGIRQPGRVSDAFVCFEDFFPTFLELAGVGQLPPHDGQSLLPLLRDPQSRGRDHVFLERERHANVRRGDLTYPVRALRTQDYLYVLNLRPDRWPAGDPELYFSVGPFGDVDPSRTKQLLLTQPRSPDIERSFQIIFSKRPAEELYDLRSDPGQVRNLADEPRVAHILQRLRQSVRDWMVATDDPRVDPHTEVFDKYPYYGQPARQPQ